MSGRPDIEWQDLFSPVAPGARGEEIALCIAHRHGAPWLILPAPRALAVQGLQLYPAQTARARWAKRLLRLALRFGLKPGLEAARLSISAEDRFAGFLRQTAQVSADAPLRFAVLAGNPNAPGRRFVFLMFGPELRPTAVVKAGLGAAAHGLLAAEEDFLRRVPRPLPGVPELRATFTAGGVRALALDFFGGDSPAGNEVARLSTLLGSWIAPERWIVLSELSTWQRLKATSGQSPLPDALKELDELRLHPAIAHGDFAPWNIKSSGGEWTVLDWERGELAGIPGWDWFHFVLQPALLVRHEPVAVLLHRLESLLDAEDFRSYGARAGITSHARELALAYVAHCLRVNRQTEGREALEQLQIMAAARWFAGKR